MVDTVFNALKAEYENSKGITPILKYWEVQMIHG